jgi:hypothetical protein
MEKKKSSRIKKAAVKKQASGRTKERPISLKGAITLKKGAFTQTKQGVKQRKIAKKIRLKIMLAKKDWDVFWRYIMFYEEEFTKQLWSNIFYPAVLEYQKAKGAKGKTREIKNLIAWIKTDASHLYVFLKYWSERPSSEWPEYLKKLISEIIKDDNIRDTIMEKDNYRTLELTAYLIDTVYREGTKGKVKSFFDPEHIDNFMVTYIQSYNITKLKEYFIGEKTPDQIADLVNQYPLNNLFGVLNRIFKLA